MITQATNASKLRARVARWAITLNVHPTQIRVQPMTRKWASCSSAGRVSFSTDLPACPKSFQDYVIAHELLHLRIRNHGKLFSATLRLYLPHNRWLKNDTSPKSR